MKSGETIYFIKRQPCALRVLTMAVKPKAYKKRDFERRITQFR
jgi:hypothetical protein